MGTDKEEDAGPEATPSAPPGRSASILVVDDDAAVREILVELLADSGHRVLQASGGTEALHALDGTPDLDLVISDVRMPEMSGFELAEQLVARRNGIKIILISGYYVSREVGWRVLRKPFRMRELEAAVQEELAG